MNLQLNGSLDQVCALHLTLFTKYTRHDKFKHIFPLRLRNSKFRFTARPFQELQFLEADANYEDFGAEKINEVVDLDFSNFDIDDHCYVVDTVNGKRAITNQFKVEIKQQQLQ